MATALHIDRRLPIGAELLPGGGAHFRVWAPKRRRMDVVLRGSQKTDASQWDLPLSADDDGYFSGFASEAVDGMGYAFRLDGEPYLRPDPASRFQPNGPTGWSQLVDSRRFNWTDAAWPGLRSSGQVLYEMHIGTFTTEGTWHAAARQFSELKRLGVTVIEMMPIADFPGQFGWGYDGVCMFAPTRLYGQPNDLRKFINDAHAAGLGVILDVVYNHFGIAENWIWEFGDGYRTNRYKNEWADAINFDGNSCGPVREFFVANARHWIEEYHFDGFRFDATQAIFDSSAEHILGQITAAARKAAGNKSLYMIAENEPQDVRTVQAPNNGGHGMDAAWNDDFHHTAHVRLTDHNPAYYSDFQGAAEELIAAIKRGFIYQGQYSQWQGKPRGTPAIGLPATAFVSFLQNHDQVANSLAGERIDRLTSPGRLRAMTALWLLAPQTPLIFQGQEFAASSPFQFFADYSGDLGKAVSEGRAKFLSQFPGLDSEEARRKLPSPTARETFEHCKLDFRERENHLAIYELHADLLRLRREDLVFARQDASRIDGASIGVDCLLLRYFGDGGDDRLLIANFGRDFVLSPLAQPLLAPPPRHRWRMLWMSDDLRYGGTGTAPLEVNAPCPVKGETTTVLKAIAVAKKHHEK